MRTPTHEREAFQHSFQMNLSKKTLDAGSTELSRLQQLRRQSFQTIVKRLREDILGLWKECEGIMVDSSSSEHSMTEDHPVAQEEHWYLEKHNEFPLYFEPLEGLEDAAVRR